ncbi:target of Nesh-SH3 [Centroberyx gerrardi]
MQRSHSFLLLLLMVSIAGIVLSGPSTARRRRVRRQNMKVRINATGDTIVMKFLRPSADTKLEGYILGYGSSMFSKQYIQLPENGQPYETEIDAEPKYLIAVQPIPANDVKKQCTGKVELQKPLHLVIGSVTPTSVLLSWGTLLKTPYEGNIMNDCLEDGHYTVRYREKSRKWNYQTCPTSDTVIDNLKPNTAYEFGVQPTSKEGSGGWSKPVVHNTNMGEKPIQKPFKPRPVKPVKPFMSPPHSFPFPPRHVLNNRTQVRLPLFRNIAPKTTLVLWHHCHIFSLSHNPGGGDLSRTVFPPFLDVPLAPKQIDIDMQGMSSPIPNLNQNFSQRPSPIHNLNQRPSPSTNRNHNLRQRPGPSLNHNLNQSPSPILNHKLNQRFTLSPNLIHNINQRPSPNLNHNLNQRPSPNLNHNQRPSHMPNLNQRSSHRPDLNHTLNQRPSHRPNLIQKPSPSRSPNHNLNHTPSCSPSPNLNQRPSHSPSPNLNQPNLNQRPSHSPSPNLNQPNLNQRPSHSPSPNLNQPNLNQRPTPSPNHNLDQRPNHSPNPDHNLNQRPNSSLSPSDNLNQRPNPSPSHNHNLNQRPSPSPNHNLNQRPSPSLNHNLNQRPSPSPNHNLNQIPSPSPNHNLNQIPSPSPNHNLNQIPSPSPNHNLNQIPSPSLNHNLYQRPSPNLYPSLILNLGPNHNLNQRPQPQPGPQPQTRTHSPPTRVTPRQPVPTAPSPPEEGKPLPRPALATEKASSNNQGTGIQRLSTAAVPRSTISSSATPTARNTTQSRTRVSPYSTPNGLRPFSPPRASNSSLSSITPGADGEYHKGHALPKPVVWSKDKTGSTAILHPSLPVNKRPNLVGKPGDHDKPMDLKQGEKESILKPFLVTAKPKHERKQTTTSAPALNSSRFDMYENSSIFSSLPASDVDALGNKRFVAPHVIYKTDKKPDEPCSITTSLAYFPEEEASEQNVTGPPRIPPSNLTVVTVEGCSSFVILDWEKSDNDTKEYEVVSKTEGPNGEEVSILTTNQTHTAVENLKPESSYEFKVTPKNVFGPGPSSERVSFSTESADPRVSENVSGKDAIWTQFPFKADAYSECNGKQYVKRTWYRKFVGIQLCNSLRYKIYLSDSLNGKFYNIGDQTGHGEDHCQFVDSFLDGRTGTQLLADQLPGREGFYRAMRQEPVNFGEIGGKSHVTYVGWYECGAPIPGKW